MLHITIVDDSPQDTAELRQCVERWRNETACELRISAYANALDFLEEYNGGCDVLLLDVDMPGINGMDAARQLRSVDQAVRIIFVTNMAQYAIAGYEVDATDFIVKPVQYFSFAQKLSRAAAHARQRRQRFVLLHAADELVRLSAEEIYRVEKDRNYLVWHTARGIIRERGTVSDATATLGEAAAGFCECSAGCLVNLRHVEQVGRDTVLVHGETVPVSRRLRKDFLQAFMNW